MIMKILQIEHFYSSDETQINITHIPYISQTKASVQLTFHPVIDNQKTCMGPAASLRPNRRVMLLAEIH